MNVTLLKALVALVPTCILFSGSVVLIFERKTVFSFLQLLGAGCLVVVVLTHVSEALHLFPWMHWRSEHSVGVGHYLDLSGAVPGLTLFPVGGAQIASTIPKTHEPAKARTNQWLRFSSAYETSIAVTAASPKIVSGFILLSESV